MVAAQSISVNESLVLFAYLRCTYAHIHLWFIDLQFMFIFSTKRMPLHKIASSSVAVCIFVQ